MPDLTHDDCRRATTFATMLSLDEHGDPLPPVRIRVDLSWGPLAPHEVRFWFRLHRDYPACWDIGRELLTQGLNGHAGLGDVSLLPDLRDRRRVELVIQRGEHRAAFRLRREFLADFLASLPEPGCDIADEIEEWLEVWSS